MFAIITIISFSFSMQMMQVATNKWFYMWYVISESQQTIKAILLFFEFIPHWYHFIFYVYDKNVLILQFLNVYEQTR